MNLGNRLQRLQTAFSPPPVDPMEQELIERTYTALCTLTATMRPEQADQVVREIIAHHECPEGAPSTFSLLTGVAFILIHDVVEGRNQGPVTLPPHVADVYAASKVFPGQPYWHMGSWVRCAACGYGFAYRPLQPTTGCERAWPFVVGFATCPLCDRDPELDRSQRYGLSLNERSN